jgi:hypothetical protein
VIVMRVLVVYYRPSSASADVAASIAETLDADTEIVVEGRDDRRGPFALLRAVTDVVRSPAIQTLDPSEARYDVVVVVAAGWEAMAFPRMRAALRRVPRSGGVAATAFVYVGRKSLGPRMLRQMERVAGRAPDAALALDRNELAADRPMRKILAVTDDVRAIARRTVDRRRARDRDRDRQHDGAGASSRHP